MCVIRINVYHSQRQNVHPGYSTPSLVGTPLHMSAYQTAASGSKYPASKRHT